MSAVMRRYFTTGAALVGAGLIAATPVAPLTPRPALHTANLDVRLMSGDSILNIPYNLFADIVNIPYVLFSKPYSVDGLIPQYPGPDGLPDFPDGTQATIDDYPAYDGPETFDGSLNFLGQALQYTGSWWLSAPTNVWGWDTANPWNFQALINLLPIPALAEPLAKNLNIIAAAEFPETEGCQFTCPNLAGELANYFQVPESELVSGYTFPTAMNPVGLGANSLGLGGAHYPEIWSGTTVHLDPSLGWNDFMQSLMADPSDNPIELPTIPDIFTGIQSFLQGFWEDFEIFTLFLNPNSVIYAIARELLGWEQPVANPLSADLSDPGALAGSLSQQLGDPGALPGDLGADLSNVTSEIDAAFGL